MHLIIKLAIMYRRLLFFCLVLITTNVIAAKTPWPNIKYAKVKVYLYNTDNSLMGNHSPVKDFKLISEISDTGRTLNESQKIRLHEWLSKDLTLLEVGLSGCYIPHHAFVFYNEKNEIVAWMSACFLCGGIRLYYPDSKYKIPKSENVKANKMAEDHLTKLKLIVEEAGLTIFNTMNEVDLYEKSKKPVVSVYTEVTVINDYLLHKLFSQKIVNTDIQKFVSDSLGPHKTDYKITAGGSKIYFDETFYKTSAFKFSGRSEDNVVLEYALVYHKEVKLFKSINIGMTRDEFMLNLPVYDGPQNPQRLILINSELSKKIVVDFANDKIVKYELFITVW